MILCSQREMRATENVGGGRPWLAEHKTVSLLRRDCDCGCG